ncbi:malonate decarboxylase holo-[acyl-carrier-protein] synthase [Lysobacter sp. CA199]|uniref:malonate decarboxylase holo-[acyl-carrier-protein] synthase n=1 Tax=Lysobacter sp. CA199 TaxID=3455608 RepID=UPI003F8D393B
MARRHDLVWLRPQAQWQALTPGAQSRLGEWFAAGLPAVVARRDGNEPTGALRLGVPLPPAEHKQRLALYADAADIARLRAPLSLSEVLPHAPQRTHRALRALEMHASDIDIEPGVFGSFAWQALTNRSYINETSDLDLLWSITHTAQAEAIVTRLPAWEQYHGLRADGELHLPGGIAVNWREYASDAKQVLVKHETGCALQARESLFARSAAA